MTAEIAVLNRNAVALAADSAVTLSLPEGPKIYQTNKLFTLSKFWPVGIMIYGSAEFMGVPWETIIKQYRSQLGKRSFARVRDYGRDFLRYVERSSQFFPPDRQGIYCYTLSRVWLWRLRSRLKKRVEEKIRSSGSVSQRTVRSLFRECILEDITHLQAHKVLERFSGITAASLVRRYRDEIRRAIKDELQKLSNVVSQNELERWCALAILRDLYWYNESGVVIAGFGNDEFFPSLRCFKVDAIVASKLRVQEDQGRRTDIKNEGTSASIVAFAQSDMVALFMNGIDSDYSAFVHSFVARSFLDGYPAMISKILGKQLSRRGRARILRRLRTVGRSLTQKLFQGISEYARKRHSEPITDIVDQLPKEELAAMAEALVNLTSFKRHVTRNAETVGGPIDVAVISRGDGFVWIKRKHYFTKDLNPHFVANYYMPGR